VHYAADTPPAAITANRLIASPNLRKKDMPDSSPANQKRRLALFLDGTWNKEDDNTNVWRLRSLFSNVSSDRSEQRIYYSTGLGTKFGERVRGGMFGSGIGTAITSAYEWLIENYEADDEIFIFGFSRGSYTARSLSGFVSKCGLLQRGAPLGVNQLWTRYRRRGAKTIRELLDRQSDYLEEGRLEESWIKKYSMAIDIKFIGVFDTVGALGVPFELYHSLTGQAYPFLNTGLRQNNEYAFHAMAIDEHRKAFRPTLWTNEGAIHAAPRSIERTEQRWFIGAHADVGGGGFNDQLAQLPFEWLKGKAEKFGLSFKDSTTPDEYAAAGTISDSFTDLCPAGTEYSNSGFRITGQSEFLRKTKGKV
jgi:uncharacterized protein (DUF2235 family)